MVSKRHMSSSTSKMTQKFIVPSSMNAGTVNTMKPTQAPMSIFLRPTLSEMRPDRKMNAM